jgi:hypothetical protein
MCMEGEFGCGGLDQAPEHDHNKLELCALTSTGSIAPHLSRSHYHFPARH